jgi:hypothetical protein
VWSERREEREGQRRGVVVVGIDGRRTMTRMNGRAVAGRRTWTGRMIALRVEVIGDSSGSMKKVWMQMPRENDSAWSWDR